MRKLIWISLVLAACSTNQPKQVEQTPPPVYAKPPAVQVVLDSQVQQMSRNDVILATQECEGNGMRASVVMSKRMISGMLSDIIVDVHCMPKLKLFQ